MAILGVGVDVVHLPRIAALIQRRTSERLACRILSKAEFADWKSLPTNDSARAVRFLAVRWSLKEAAYKALFAYIRPSWKQFTYIGVGECSNACRPILKYNALTTPGPQWKFHSSVSHDGEYVFTTVIVEE